MRITRTEWTEADRLILTPDASSHDQQPGIGIEICWNIPQQWWKPYIVFHFWHIHYQIGWLADYKQGMA